ncbi:hypothetical protein MAR_018847 [Mya arenaria]|uniref:Uncharacterized protein n=1 Tax=Mya arenaria TaxID=6604 RepID=A0ABY7EIN7_MYAAR|nr:hypothetical protein MAR_018847 [Mya arenaria]
MIKSRVIKKNRASPFTCGVNFCQLGEVKDRYSDGVLYAHLNASNDVIKDANKFVAFSCICDVTAEENVDILTIRSDVLPATDTCTKRFDITANTTSLYTNGKLGCFTEHLEIHALKKGEKVTIVMHTTTDELKSGSADVSVLYIVPTPGVTLRLQCLPPTRPSSVSSKFPTSSTSSSTMNPTTSTSKKIIVSDAVGTGVIVGVVIGLGLFFLVLISCLLLFIARRGSQRENKDIKTSPEKPTTNQRTRVHHRLVRTMTDMYDKIKTRPLPSIPKSFRRQGRAMQLGPTESGTYASLRLDFNAACPNGHPSTDLINNNEIMTTGKESGSRNDKKDVHKLESKYSCNSDTSYIEPAVPIVIQTNKVSEEVSSTYITPFSGENGEDNIGVVASEKGYRSNDSPTHLRNTSGDENYSNGISHTQLKLQNDTFYKQDSNYTTPEGESTHDEIYVNTGIKDNVEDIYENTKAEVLNKQQVIQVDSNGYAPMNAIPLRISDKTKKGENENKCIDTSKATDAKDQFLDG